MKQINKKTSTQGEDKEEKNLEFWWVRSTSETCEFFGVSAQTLSDWEKRGAPKEGYGKWDIKKLIDWKYGSKSKEKSDEVRKLAAEAKYKEAKAAMAAMDQAVMEGKYVEKAEVDRQWSIVGTVMKTNLMLWARTLTPYLAHQDMRSVEKILTNAVYDVLEQLSSNGQYHPKNNKK